MGVIYYAVNRKNKTFYDLGKGGWDVLNDDKEALFDLEYLTHEILHECFDIDDRKWMNKTDKADPAGSGQPPYLLIDYVTTRIAPDLFEFVEGAEPSDITIINDCTDDIFYMKCLGYRCVGCRYHLDKTSEEYKKSVASSNRHFEPERAHRYKISNLSQRQLGQLVFLQDESKY